MRILAVVVIASAACANDPTPLGADERDALTLSATPGAYLVDAIADGDVTLQSLFEKGDSLAFNGAPNPSALLASTSALDDARLRDNKVPVPVLSYNVALLDAQIFGFVDYKKTPSLTERRTVMPDLIFDGSHDIICLQEVWKPEDAGTFRDEGAALGYRAFAHDRRAYDDGVMIFIREDAIAGGTGPTLEDHAPYLSQDGLEYFPGPGIKRGWIEVAFRHAQAGPTRVFCTHMQAFPEAWNGRMKQARELGIAARTHSQEGELVVVAGDMNAGPYYKSADWAVPGGTTESTWFHNTLSYPLLLAYGNLVDATIMGRTAQDALLDVTLGDTVVNDAATSTTIPGAAADWCATTPPTNFTATDCNTLYFAQYAGTEYPARIDHVLVQPRDDLVVSQSKILFTDPIAFGAITTEPSDHYGVSVELFVDAALQ